MLLPTPTARHAQVTTLVKGISPSEYDAAVDRTPAMCPLWVMGDRRTGRELLADVSADRGICLARCGAGRWERSGERRKLGTAFLGEEKEGGGREERRGALHVRVGE